MRASGLIRPKKLNITRLLLLSTLAVLFVLGGGLLLATWAVRNGSTFTGTPAVATSTLAYTVVGPSAQGSTTLVVLNGAATITAPAIRTSSATPGMKSFAPNGNLQVHFIDIGQGDSILIIAPDGTAMLIDGGNPGSGALAYLQAHGIKRITLMVATHPHADHIGGLVDILKAMPVDQVLTNGYPYTTSIYEQFLDAIAAAKVPYREVSSGDTVQFGARQTAVLNPVKGKNYSDINESSIVLRLQYGATSFLFSGDAGSLAEHDMLSAGVPLQADILKVGHHGSYTSSTPEFLQAVQPKLAIYSAGKNNPYGHPHQSTLDNLNRVGATIYGTDVDGSVVVLADKQGYTVSTSSAAGPLTLPRPPTASPIAQPTQSAAPTTTPPVPRQPLATSTAPSATPAVALVGAAPGHRNGTATLQLQTAPGAHCTITVLYKSGPSSAAGLDDKYADSRGLVSWSWKVGGNTTPGTWQIVVTADNGSQQVSKTIPFQVVR